MASRGVLLLGLLVACFGARAANYCVSTGSELRDALTGAAANQENDLIKLAIGTYTSSTNPVAFAYFTNDSFDLTLDGGYIDLVGNPCGLHTNDAKLTVLDGQGARQVLRLLGESGTNGTIRVHGLTIRNGYDPLRGGGARLGGGTGFAGTVDVDRVLFDHNKSDGYAGGLSIGSSSGLVFVRDSEFWANSSHYGNAALEVTANYTPASATAVLLGNNTFVANQCLPNADPACAATLRVGGSARAVIYNTVFAFTEDPHLQLDNDHIDLFSTNFLTLGGNVPANAAGNLALTNPEFVDLFNHDYRLMESSPLRDHGTPDYALGRWDADGHERTNGPQVDMGAYEFQDVAFADDFEAP